MQYKLRKLKAEDQDRMLEWMHDKRVTEKLLKDFSSCEKSDCEKFISLAQKETEDVHFAISDETDLYMGTVSLKHIKNGEAEFAIVLHHDAWGHGYANYAMNKIIEIGFSCYNLDTIYWFVGRDNGRAVGFYEKHKYNKVEDVPAKYYEESGCSSEDLEKYIWYSISK